MMRYLTEQGFSRLFRVLQALGCAAGAAVLVWHAHHFVDPRQPSDLTVPLMCVSAAVILLMTAVSISITPSEESEA